jgi:hypothetical protein
MKNKNNFESSYRTIRELRTTEENILRILEDSLRKVFEEAGSEISLKEIALLHIAKSKVSDEVQKLVSNIEVNIDLEIEFGKI